MTAARGFSVVEALVGVVLAGVALAGLSAVAGLATRTLGLARDTTTAVALAEERLEALRGAERADGSDAETAADGTRFSRRWSTAGGRGRPARLSVHVAWGARALELETETLP